MPVVRKAVREHWARSFSLVHSFENNQGSYDTVRTPDTARGRTWVIQYKLHSSAGASTTYISLHRLTFAILRSYAEQFKVRTELILLRKHIDFYVTTSKLGNLAAITNILQQDSRARFPLFGIIHREISIGQHTKVLGMLRTFEIDQVHYASRLSSYMASAFWTDIVGLDRKSTIQEGI
jgi:hypothetical protein